MAYQTVSGADTYFDERLDSDVWVQASSTNKTKALATATRYIDALNFAGDKADAAQENEFPRGTDTVIPQAIKDATCEIAIALLDGVNIEYQAEQGNVESVKYGPGSLRKESDWIPEHITHGIPSIVAWNLLRPYLRDATTLTLKRVS